MLPRNHLSILINTVCNRHCPDCCFQIPQGRLPPRHEPWAAFELAAKYFRGIDYLYVVGGEPTLHPEFARVAREFRTLFDAGFLAIATNGARLIEHGDVMDRFDEVRLTDFDDPRSQAAIAWMRAHSPANLRIIAAEHVPIGSRPGTARCDFHVALALMQGRVYPCCEAPGVVGAGSVELGDGWQERLAAVALPCRDCIFARPQGREHDAALA